MGITQEKAAEYLDISTRWYQDIENGKHLCSVELALKIIAFFGIDGKASRDEEKVAALSSHCGTALPRGYRRVHVVWYTGHILLVNRPSISLG